MLVGSGSKDRISGKGGDDVIHARGGKDIVSGGRGDDVLHGGKGDDKLDGDRGDDLLRGGKGDDCLDGGSGDDLLVGGRGEDDLDGGRGDDRLYGGKGDDDLDGGAGDDLLVGGRGNDDLDGGCGRDIAKYTGSVFDYRISIERCEVEVKDLNRADGDSGRDELSDIEEIHFDDRVIYLDGRNNDPLAKDDQADTAEDAGVTIAVLDNDRDVDGRSKLEVVSIDASGTLGQVSLNPDGTIAYDPNGEFDHLADGETATDTFSYTIRDKHGGSDTAAVTVTIIGKGAVNDAPVAQDDAFTTAEDVALLGNVLADNGAGADADADGDALTVSTTPVSGPANGTLALAADGSFTYTPDADFHGADSFTYEVSDGNGDTDQATVAIAVDPVNDDPVAQDDAFTTDEDVALAGNVLLDDGVDADPDGDALTVDTTPVSGPANGTLVLAADGSFTYAPDPDFHGADSFTYEIADGNGGTDEATVTITVDPVNDPPVAQADAFTTDEDVALVGNVLADNGAGADADPEGDALAVDTTPVAGPANGTLVLAADGSFTYTPNAGFHGTDGFTYEVADGNGGTDQATVTITVDPVNDAPIAQDDAFTTAEDVALTGNVLLDSGVDTDPDGDALTVDTTPVAGPANGTLALAADGSFTYTPDADFHGADGFTYEIADGNGGTGQATVTITVDPVNDPPVAQADAFTTDEDVALVGNVLADNGAGADADVDGDALTVDTTPVAGPAHGTLDLAADGSFTYTPDPDFHGADSFTYEVADGNGGTDQATVAITVDPVADIPDPPSITVNDGVDDVQVQEDGSVGVSVVARLSANAEPAEFLTVTITGLDPAWGTVTAPVGTFNAAGTEWTFTLPAGQDLSTVLTFTPAADGELDLAGLVATATATNPDEGTSASSSDGFTVIVEAVNDTPVAQDVAVAAQEDGAAVIADFAGDDVDSDDDGTTLTYAIATQPPEGSVVDNGDGTFTFDPGAAFQDLAEGETRDVTFTYTATDSHGATSDSATVTVTVTGTNDDPVAQDDAFTTDEDVALTGNVLLDDGVDTDPDGDPLAVDTNPVSGPANGALALNADGSFTYTPDADFHGADSFTYAVSDGDGGTDQATVTITVHPVQDFPVGRDDAFTTAEDVAVGGNVLADNGAGADGDPDGDVLIVDTVPISGPANGTLVLNADGSFTYTPDPDFHGADSFTYEVADGNGGTDEATVAITVDPVNDDPVAQDVAVAAQEDGPAVTADFAADDVDSDDDPATLTYAIAAQPAEGSVVDNGDGTFTFDPGADFQDLALGETRDVSFTYTATDSHGATSNSATVTVTVTGTNDEPVTQDVAAPAQEDGAAVTVAFAGNDVDSDDDGSTLTYAITAQPAEGSVVDNGNGTFTFDPGTAFQDLAEGETRDVSFTYTATDTHGATSDSATVTVTVTGANDAPVAQDVMITAQEDGGAVTMAFAGDDVDSDDDGTTLAYGIAAQPAEGSVIDNGDGTFTFDPGVAFQDLALGETRDVSFTYTATDSHGATSNSATVTLTITGANDVPTDLALTNATVGSNLPDVTVGVLSAEDADTNDTLAFSIVPGLDASHFVLEGNQLKVGSAGLDFPAGTVLQVAVRATDPHGAFTEQTFAITVQDRQVITLTPNADTVTTPADGAYVVGTAATLNPGDTLTGDLGRDSLLLYNAGQFRVDQLQGFTGFEEIQLISFAGSADLWLPDGLDIEINGGGNGSKIYRLGSGQETITGGAGQDVFFASSAAALTPTDALNGGLGFDFLQLSLPSGTTFDLRGLELESIESLSFGTFNGVLQVDQASLAGFTSISGSSNAKLVTDEAALDLTGKSLSSLVTVETSNPDGTVFTVSNVNTAFQIRGGPGADTLVANTGTFTEEQREQIFATLSIETIVDGAGTHVSSFDAATPRLTTGNDVIVLPPEGGQVLGTAETLGSGDSLTGGAGHDTLLLYGTGHNRLDLVSTFTGFEEIQLVSATNSATLFLPDGLDIAINGGGTGFKTYRLGTGQETITGGAGQDQFFVSSTAALTPTDALNGGLGSDILSLSLPGGTIFDLRPLDPESVEQLNFNTSNGVLLVDQASLAGFTSISGNSNAKLVTDEAALDLTGKFVNGISIESSNPGGTVFTVNNLNTALQIGGGPGADTLVAIGLTLTGEQREQIFATASIETIVDNAGTHVSPFDAATQRLTTGNDAIVVGAGGGQVLGTAETLGSGDSLTGGAGQDTLSLYGAGTYRLDLVSTFTGFEEIQLVNSSGSADLVLPDGLDIEINGGGTGFKRYRLGTGEETITGGAGRDDFLVTGDADLTAADALNGGLGSLDLLQLGLPNGTIFDLRGLDLEGIERLQFSTANGVLLVDQASLTDVTSIFGSGSTKLVTEEAALDLSGKSVSNATIESSNPDGTVFTVNNLNIAFQVIGGPGADTLVFTNALLSPEQRDAIFANSIEVIRDATGFYGDAGDNTISGTSGNDTIRGGAGADTLNGGLGNDTLIGEPDADRFVYQAPNEGVDTIADLAPGEDMLEIHANGFGGGLVAGALAADRLVVAADPAPTEAHGQFLYDTDTGALYWDADGTGTDESPVQLAELTGAPLLSADDFSLV